MMKVRVATRLSCYWFFNILILCDGLFSLSEAVASTPRRSTTAVACLPTVAAFVATKRSKAVAFLPPTSVISSRHYSSTSRPCRCFSGRFQQGLLQLKMHGALTDAPVAIAAAAAAGGANLLEFGSRGSSNSINWMFVWPLRFMSALVSYIGLIAYFDRPRGELYVTLDDDIQIQPSNVAGAGLGLFAKVALPKGTVLGTYPGVLVPLSQNLPKLQAYPACEGYIWRFSDNRYVIDPTNAQGEIQETCRFGGNPSLPGSIWICRYILPLFLFFADDAGGVDTALCRINEPPRGCDVNVVTIEDSNSRTVTFVLERDVGPDEEFYIDYGISYDRSRYGGGSASGGAASSAILNEKEED